LPNSFSFKKRRSAMDTQIDLARRGLISDEVRHVADREGIDPGLVREGVARGEIVILASRNRKHGNPVGVGKGLRTKVNANIGTSPDCVDKESEREKLMAALRAGADAVMDLSTGGGLSEIRKMVLELSTVPVGSVPIYEAAVRMARRGRRVVDMTPDDIFGAIEDHLKDGIDFITVHCGVTRAALERLANGGRTTGVVSRGGSFLVKWMLHNGKENPLYEHYDRLLELAREYDAVLSLGDGLRPGSLADATDRPQLHELIILGELVERARDHGVQAMVEGPGHIPLNEVQVNVLLEKKLCKGAPFYVLGPIVVDFASGYDHIAAGIGGAVAAWAGADFLCYVTPSEHLGLPNPDDVYEGVIATRIAAHAGDIAKGIRGAREVDDMVSKARKSFDWESAINLSIDPDKARRIRERYGTQTEGKKCTMCGEFCAMRDEL